MYICIDRAVTDASASVLPTSVLHGASVPPGVLAIVRSCHDCNIPTGAEGTTPGALYVRRHPADACTAPA